MKYPNGKMSNQLRTRMVDEEDGCTHLEVITRAVFSGDKGRLQGTNLSFVWAIIHIYC